MSGAAGKPWVLLVFRQQDAALCEEIRKAFAAAGAIVDIDTTLAPLGERLRQRAYRYIVAGQELARDEASPVREDGGLALCDQVRRRSQVPIALIVPRLRSSIQLRSGGIRPPAPQMLERDNCRLGELLVAQMRNAEAAPKGPGSAKRLDIVIRTATDKWSYEMFGRGFHFPRTGKLNTNSELLELQRDLSARLLDRPQEWYASFSKLGKNMVRDLLARSKKFKKDLDQGLELAGSIENTRLTFSVARNFYEIALEAIFRPDQLEPWMVHAPLVRNIRGVAPGSGQLFEGQDPEPLSCLVICADTSGVVNSIAAADGQVTILDDLKAIQTESENVCKMLAAQGKQVGAVVPLGGDGKALTSDRLLTVLRDGYENEPWDIVHYAGHSKFHHKDGQELGGYLFVGSKDEPEAVNISTVAPYLRGTKLLYLSSCESANAPFAVAAADQGVPAVIGFRWPIPDTEAERHAKLFYDALFRKQAIDTAFWSVRKELHDTGRNTKTWASSVLMMQ